MEAAEGRLPLWMGLAGVQASSIKHQASIRGGVGWVFFDDSHVFYMIFLIRLISNSAPGPPIRNEGSVVCSGLLIVGSW